MGKSKNPHDDGDHDIYRLIKMAQLDDSDRQAKDEIVKHYEKLVHALANKFSRRSSMHEDLFQVGIIGLLGAVKRYDDSYDKSFEAFAIPTIIGEIKRYIRDKTWSVHVPRRVKELGPKIKAAVEILTSEKQRSPKVEEIADYLSVSEEEVLETMEMGNSYHPLSVDNQVEADNEGSKITLLDLVGKTEDGYEQTNQRLLIEDALRTLTQREQKIINYIFYKNYSQKEAGQQLSISQMHVSRIQRKALDKLRKALKMEPSEALK